MSHEQQTKKPVTVLNSAKVPLILVSLMWGVHIINWLFPLLKLNKWGVLPRHIDGLWGIICSPFLHGDWSHLINNTPPTLILGWALYYFYRNIATEIILLSALMGGGFVWIAARESYHIGMSGIIYALAFFIFFSGVFRKEPKLLAIALFVVFLYGSMVWGVLPIDLKISFEGHLFGALSGIALAYFYKKEGETFVKKKYQFEKDEERDQRLMEQGYTRYEDENGFTVKYEYIPEEKPDETKP
ncbi:MAG: membrane associated rhomboid family serine protease [Flavobacteriales bacterium]|jgi:membrane associated rhomboid family serine protease